MRFPPLPTPPPSGDIWMDGPAGIMCTTTTTTIIIIIVTTITTTTDEAEDDDDGQ